MINSTVRGKEAVALYFQVHLVEVEATVTFSSSCLRSGNGLESLHFAPLADPQPLPSLLGFSFPNFLSCICRPPPFYYRIIARRRPRCCQPSAGPQVSNTAPYSLFHMSNTSQHCLDRRRCRCKQTSKLEIQDTTRECASARATSSQLLQDSPPHELS